MTRQYDIRGVRVSEEEAANILGFKDVDELNRWDTAQGQRVAELERKLHEAEGDRDQFLWAVRRMQAVLEMIRPVLVELHDYPPPEGTGQDLKKLILGIDVVCGTGVDWGKTLADWWPQGETNR